MTKTEYLFGFPKEKYHGIPFPEVGYERIKDAKILRNKLQERMLYYPEQQNKFQRYLRKRIPKVLDAIRTWEKILEIEES